MYTIGIELVQMGRCKHAKKNEKGGVFLINDLIFQESLRKERALAYAKGSKAVQLVPLQYGLMHGS
jgi:hypothetical protein